MNRIALSIVLTIGLVGCGHRSVNAPLSAAPSPVAVGDSDDDDRMQLIEASRGRPDNPGARGHCISACAHAAVAALHAEQALHKANVEACALDPTCDPTVEAERHVLVIHAIRDQRRACIRACVGR